ncbi:MAG: hypothetical protein IJY08_02545 [Clostridia bacterium]|nr:hypothetical protein [Clostridia bacterium]
MNYLFCVLISYLIGAINPSYIIEQTLARMGLVCEKERIATYAQDI